MKIYAPVKDFNGVRNNVRFINGVGETDNPLVIVWFETNGYEVVDEKKVLHLDENPVERLLDMIELHDEPAAPKELEDMTPMELREWAKENGFGSLIKNTRDKDKLLKIIRG